MLSKLKLLAENITIGSAQNVIITTLKRCQNISVSVLKQLILNMILTTFLTLVEIIVVKKEGNIVFIHAYYNAIQVLAQHVHCQEEKYHVFVIVLRVKLDVMMRSTDFPASSLAKKWLVVGNIPANKCVMKDHVQAVKK